MFLRQGRSELSRESKFLLLSLDLRRSRWCGWCCSSSCWSYCTPRYQFHRRKSEVTWDHLETLSLSRFGRKRKTSSLLVLILDDWRGRKLSDWAVVESLEAFRLRGSPLAWFMNAICWGESLCGFSQRLRLCTQMDRVLRIRYFVHWDQLERISSSEWRAEERIRWETVVTSHRE